MLAFSSMSNSLSHKRREDDARGVGARQRGVEHVGIVAHADAQMCPGRRLLPAASRQEPRQHHPLSVSSSVPLVRLGGDDVRCPSPSFPSGGGE